MMYRSALLALFSGLLLAVLSIGVQSAPLPVKIDSRVMTSPRITFYSGNQLQAPACGGPTPTRNSMIAAVKQGGRFKCGDRIHIKSKQRQVSVKVVDYCESCSTLAVDLTPGAFEKLASLDEGIIKGAQMWVA